MSFSLIFYYMLTNQCKCDCVKSARIRSYSVIRSIPPYLIRMRENTDQNNSEYRHFSRSVYQPNMNMYGTITQRVDSKRLKFFKKLRWWDPFSCIKIWILRMYLYLQLNKEVNLIRIRHQILSHLFSKSDCRLKFKYKEVKRW